jgi:hypothetical protein
MPAVADATEARQVKSDKVKSTVPPGWGLAEGW